MRATVSIYIQGIRLIKMRHNLYQVCVCVRSRSEFESCYFWCPAGLCTWWSPWGEPCPPRVGGTLLGQDQPSRCCTSPPQCFGQLGSTSPQPSPENSAGEQQRGRWYFFNSSCQDRELTQEAGKQKCFILLPLVHLVSSAAQWLWVCWGPVGGRTDPAQGEGTPAPL